MVAVTEYPLTFRPAMVLVVREIRHGQVGVFHVHRVELAGAPVVGIEIEPIEAVAVAARNEKTMEEARPVVAPVEVQILRKLSGFLVEDVERPVHIRDEQPWRASWFFADGVDPGEQHFIRRLAEGHPRDRHGREVLNLERQRLLRLRGRRQAHDREKQTGNPHVSPLG